jgi:hypothetical protein
MRHHVQLTRRTVFGVGRRAWPIKPPGTVTLEPMWGMQEAGTTTQPGLSHGNCKSALDPCCETPPIPGLPGQPSQPTTHFDANFCFRRVSRRPGHPKVASEPNFIQERGRVPPRALGSLLTSWLLSYCHRLISQHASWDHKAWAKFVRVETNAAGPPPLGIRVSLRCWRLAIVSSSEWVELM